MPHEETFPSLRPNGSNTVWATILHLAARHAYPAGYPLDLIGAALTDFYYIEKGRLLITYTSQNGRERPILTIEHGNIFNASTALTGFDNPDSQYLCLDDTILWRFPGSLLTSPDFVRQYPELIINLMQSLGNKTLQMHQTLSYTGPDTELVQLARWLSRAADDHGALSFRPNLTQQDLANMLGIHRATLVRCIHTLRKQGIVRRFSRNALDIIDPNALHRLAEQ